MKDKSAPHKLNAVLGILVITSVVLATGSALYDYLSLKSDLAADMENTSEAIVSRLAVSLKEPLWNMDKQLAQELVKIEMAEKMIYAVVVSEANQGGFTAFKRNDAWQIIESKGEEGPGAFSEKGRQIVRNDKKLGNVKIFITDRFMQESLCRSLMIIGVKTLIVAFGLVAVLFLLMKMFLMRPVSRVIEGLSRAGDGVGSASFHVLESGESLARGTSEMAQFLRNTTSALNETASVAKENAQKAGHANTLMSEASQVVHSANQTMDNLMRAMEDIDRKSVV